MTTLVGSAPAQEAAPAKTVGVPVVPLLWFGALLALCYAPVLSLLTWQWFNDEDMGHGLFVPVVAAYIAWQRWGELAGQSLRPNYWGLLVVAYAGLQLLLATLGAELFLARTAFVMAVIGAVFFLGGTRTLKVMAFPLFLLFFMIPLPSVIYNQITLKLQFIASDLAERLLSLTGVPVLQQGNVLHLASQDLNVVEACSGIRSLLTLTFLSLVYAYVFDGRVWMRWALLILTVPIAIAANALRVTITGLLSEWNPEYAQGLVHTAEGWVIFVIALIILVAVHQLLDRTIRFTSARHAH